VSADQPETPDFDGQIRETWLRLTGTADPREDQLKAFYAWAFPRLWVAVNRFLSKRAKGAAVNEVDDATQDTMIRFQQAIESGSLTPQDRVLPWIFTVAKNCLTDRVRRLMRESELPDDVDAKVEAVDFLADERFAEKLQEIFRAMPERTRAVFAMYADGGLSQDEMAAVINVPVTTIAYEMKNVKMHLKQLVEYDQPTRNPTHKSRRPKSWVM
jgi:RNA polymerase sigma factor (sigma-70 family)